MVDPVLPAWLASIQLAAQNNTPIDLDGVLFPANSQAAKAVSRFLTYLNGGSKITLAGTKLISTLQDEFVEFTANASFQATLNAPVSVTVGIGENDAAVFAVTVTDYKATLSTLFTDMLMPALPKTVLESEFSGLQSGMVLDLFSHSIQGPMLILSLSYSTISYVALGYLKLDNLGFTLTRGCHSALEAIPDANTDSVSVALTGAIGVATSNLISPILIELDMPSGGISDVWAISLLQPTAVSNVVNFVTDALTHIFKAENALGSNGISDHLPESLINDSGVMIETFELVVKDSSFELLHGGIGFTTNNSWIPVPGIVLNDAGFGITLDFIGITSAALSVHGAIAFGNDVYLGAQANVPVILGPGPQPDWELTLQGSVDFGSEAGTSLETIPMFQGQSPVLHANNLPSAFLEMKKIVLTAFTLRFNPFDTTGGVIKQMDLFLVGNLEAGWADMLTISEPKFNLQMTNPFDPSREVVAGGSLMVNFGKNLKFLAEAEYKKPGTGDPIWSVSGHTTRPFTLQEAANDVQLELSTLTGLVLDPITAPGFIGGITVNSISASFTTDGPKTTVDWALSFPTNWSDPIDFTGHIGVTHAGKNGDVPPDIALNLVLGITSDVTLSADINVGPEAGNLSATHTSFTLAANSKKPFMFEDLRKSLKLTNLPAIPPGFDPALKSMAFSYDSEGPQLSATMESANYGKASLLGVAVDVGDDSIIETFEEVEAAAVIEHDIGFGLNLNKRIDLGNLPVLGKFMPDNLSFGFDNFALALAHPRLPRTAATQLFNNIGRPGGLGEWKGDFQAAVAIDLFYSDTTIPLAFAFGASAPVGSDGKGEAQDVGLVGVDEPPTSGANTVNWIDVQKSFGPLSVRRVGLSMSDDGMAFPMDIALTFAGLQIEANGLQVGLPFKGMSEHFALSGLGISFDRPPIYAGAALEIATSDELAKWEAENGGKKIEFAFSGIAMLRASEKFALAGVGGYAQLETAPAFFIFAEAEAPLGGPPFLQITGASAGLGVNYRMRQPRLNEIVNNPFVVGLFPGENSGPLAVLSSLTRGDEPWLSIHEGEFWLALGIEFSVAEIFKTKAVAILSIGSPVQLGVYGISDLVIPPDSSVKLAEIQISWMASLIPEEAIFTAGGTLTPNSFILVDKAKLTGSFWIYIRGNPTNPYFAYSVGGFRTGYSPGVAEGIFVPRLDRLGFDWRISSDIHIKGGAYYALTPNAMMAGGHLNASFSFWAFKAWFDVNASFLLNWAPETFIGDLSVTVGVSVTIKVWFIHKTFTGEFHIAVHIEGPPLQGKAQLRFMGIPINVSFNWNNGVSDEKYVPWPAFKKQYIGPDSEINTIKVGDGKIGVIPERFGAIDAESGDAIVVVPPQTICSTSGFSMFIDTKIPLNSLVVTNSKTLSGKKPDIRPVKNATAINSIMTLNILKNGVLLTAAEMSKWDVAETKTSTPTAMWGKQNDGEVNLKEAAMIPDCLTGVTISTKAPDIVGPEFEVKGGQSGSVVSGISYEPIVLANAKILPYPGPADSRGALISDDVPAAITAIEQINESAALTRKKLFEDLKTLGFGELANDPLVSFAKNAWVLLPGAPMLTGAAQ